MGSGSEPEPTQDGAVDIDQDAAPEQAADAGPDGEGEVPCDDVLRTPANCGQCGHDCGGATCVEGLCTPETLSFDVAPDVLTDELRPLFVEGNHLYLQSDYSSTGNSRADLATLALTKVLDGDRLRAADGALYAMERVDNYDEELHESQHGLDVYRASPSAPTERELVMRWAPGSVLYDRAIDFAVAGGRVYATEWCSTLLSTALGDLDDVPEDMLEHGCNSSRETEDIVVDESGAHVYVLNTDKSFVWDVDTANNQVTIVNPTGFDNVTQVAAGNGALYAKAWYTLDASCDPLFADCATGLEVFEVAPGAAAVRSLGKLEDTFGVGFEVQGEHVYLAHGNGVVRYATDGSEPLVLYEGTVESMTVGEQHVFISNGTDILRVAR